VKTILFFVGSVLLAISATSRAAPPGGGFRGGGGGFHGRFIGHNAGPAFTMGHGFRRDFGFHDNRFFDRRDFGFHDNRFFDRRDFRFHQNRFFDRRDHRFFVQQVIWPFYWYPYYGLDYYPWDASYLDYGPDNDYSYASAPAAPTQPEYSGRTSTPQPIVVVVNQGSSRSTDNPSAGYANSSYGSTGAEGKPRMVAQGSNQQSEIPVDPSKLVSPAAPQAAQAAVQIPRAVAKPLAGSSAKFVLVSWLNDDGKDAIVVQDVETNETQRITSEPNREDFRIVAVHPNADPKEFEAIISNGDEQIPVRFRF